MSILDQKLANIYVHLVLLVVFWASPLKKRPKVLSFQIWVKFGGIDLHVNTYRLTESDF